jgi:hypothetical protein
MLVSTRNEKIYVIDSMDCVFRYAISSDVQNRSNFTAPATFTPDGKFILGGMITDHTYIYICAMYMYTLILISMHAYCSCFCKWLYQCIYWNLIAKKRQVVLKCFMYPVKHIHMIRIARWQDSCLGCGKWWEGCRTWSTHWASQCCPT